MNLPTRDAKAAVTSHPRENGASELVFRAVLEALYRGEFQPGQRLTEAALTAKLQVSRSSVREGLNRLASEGVVTLERHRGACIRRVSREEHLDTLAVLDVLIGLAARLAAANIEQAGNREVAESELRRLVQPAQGLDAFDFARERNRFYRVLLTLAGNKTLQRLMSQVSVHMMRMQLGAPRRLSVGFADYIGILAAVLAGDSERAELVARAHVATNTREISQMDSGGEAAHHSPAPPPAL